MQIPWRRRDENHELELRVLMLITNLNFVKLEEFGIINWTRNTKSVIPLIVPGKI